ncbi:hypothetical protein MATL_G00221140 [Megalops atlanticus]|uniref:Uncharacterized protein n=1 Tax=Megalops atlanticus TaxID=7932 RepID=A0A9D3T2X0_MEGAT|nr:hypothetical protein MATL_G00221140 [Megalops atlanticus]
MSNCIAFHTQIASIMEVLANAAVAEICKLVDDGYAVLRLEMSQSQKENKALKRKLQMMELRIAGGLSERREQETSVNNRPHGVHGCDKFRRIGTEEHFPTEGRLPVRPVDSLGRDGETAAVDGDVSPVQPAVMRDECADMEEGRTELLIKEERLEEDNEAQGEMKIRAERAVESRAGGGERTPIQDTQNKAAQHTEELTEQHRTRHSAWEPTEMEEQKPESLLIKEERPAGDLRRSDPGGGLKNREERAVSLSTGIGEGAPSVDTHTPPAQHTEELTEQHRTRHSAWECADMEEGRTEQLIKEERSVVSDGVRKASAPDSLREAGPCVWEVSGLEAALGAKQRLQHGESDGWTGRQNSLGSEHVTQPRRARGLIQSCSQFLR